MIKVMMSGLPGRMATLLAEHLVEANDFELVPFALTGPNVTADDVEIGGITVRLMPPKHTYREMEEVMKTHWPFLTADFSLAKAVNDNARFYKAYKLPFIMGTTGGNREVLMNDMETANIPAVIAPNMAKPLVALMAAVQHMAEEFHGAFSGFSGIIVESHQSTKQDVSGTARAMVQPLMDLGVICSEQDIISVREPMLQREIGVPESALGGHAYHAYTLVSPIMLIRLIHNVIGRDIYALGALDALRFLQQRVDAGDKGVYTMLDVLRSG